LKSSLLARQASFRTDKAFGKRHWLRPPIAQIHVKNFQDFLIKRIAFAEVTLKFVISYELLKVGLTALGFMGSLS
jgi:hypothetical protein